MKSITIFIHLLITLITLHFQILVAQQEKPFHITLYLDNSPPQWVKFKQYNAKVTFLDSIWVDKKRDTLVVQGKGVQYDLIHIGATKKGGFPFLPIYGDSVKVWIDFDAFTDSTYYLSHIKIENSPSAIAYHNYSLEFEHRFRSKTRKLYKKIHDLDFKNSINTDSLKNIYQSEILRLKNEAALWCKYQFQKSKYPHDARLCLMDLEGIIRTYSPIEVSNEDLKGMYKVFLDKFPNHNLAKVIKEKLESPILRKEGKFIDIKLPNTKGDSISLSDFKDKYVLLDFWASWCAPCRAEHGTLRHTYQKYKEKKFTIYSVSLDTDKEKWLQAIDQDNIGDWTQCIDTEYKSASHSYNVLSIPANFLISPEGKIIAMNLRGEALLKKLEELLGE